MGMMINRRRACGGKSHKTININVKTHSTGNTDASLDVITGDGNPVNILYKNVRNTGWANEYIQVKYIQYSGSWIVSAVTSCLYDGQVYNSGDLIAAWPFKEIKNITIVANI
jgi:hypothetical protein